MLFKSFSYYNYKKKFLKKFKKELSQNDYGLSSYKLSSMFNTETSFPMFELYDVLNNKGIIKLYRYPNRPEFVPLDNSDLIPKIIDWNNRGFKNAINNFLQIYPELEDKLCEQMNQKDNKTNTQRK